MSVSLRDCLRIFPSINMGLDEQMKCLIKLTVLSAIIVYLLGTGKTALHFLIYSGVVLAIIYFIQKRRCVEGYLPLGGNPPLEKNSSSKSGGVRYVDIPNSDLPQLNRARMLETPPPRQKMTAVGIYGEVPYCDDGVDSSDPRVSSLNQSLAGRPNPKTKMAPLVPVRTHDLDYWKQNNLITHTAINDNREVDLYLSGYAVSTCCSSGCDKCRKQQLAPVGVRENYSSSPQWKNIVAPTPTDARAFIPSLRQQEYPNQRQEYFGYSNRRNPTEEDDSMYKARGGQAENSRTMTMESFQAPYPSDGVPTIPRLKNSNMPIRENYAGENDMPRRRTDDSVYQNPPTRPNESGWMNTSCGYDPTNINYNIPNNLAAGRCDRTLAMSEFNKNIFTQNVGQDDFSFNQVNEPINSNIGISFTQQFEPTSAHQDMAGNKFYTANDPRLYTPPAPSPYIESVRPDNVYDPRSGGYGTSYRAYVDEFTGQPRFMYDDIDSVRAPNYITRSKIDNQPFAESYGTMDNNFNLGSGENAGNPSNPDIRMLAQDKWMRDSIEFRQSMSNSLMRKRNAEMWQQRIAPLNMSHRG